MTALEHGLSLNSVCYGLNCVSSPALTPTPCSFSTSDWNWIWRYGLWRGNSVRVGPDLTWLGSSQEEVSTHTHRSQRPREREDALYQPRREASEETEPVDTGVSDRVCFPLFFFFWNVVLTHNTVKFHIFWLLFYSYLLKSPHFPHFLLPFPLRAGHLTVVIFYHQPPWLDISI